jgi:hypothetical protein
MTTPQIDAAREALNQAEAEVDRLRAKLRAELADQDARGVSAEARPQRLGWTDGVAEARRRYGTGEATGDAPPTVRDQADEDPAVSGATAGREEARRRMAARRP